MEPTVAVRCFADWKISPGTAVQSDSEKALVQSDERRAASRHPKYPESAPCAEYFITFSMVSTDTVWV
jgi:hypothetical protein